MQGRSGILYVNVVSSLEIRHHSLREPHVEVCLDRVQHVTLIEVRVCEQKLHLKLIDDLVDFLLTSALPWSKLTIASFDLNFDLCVIKIELISSDHVFPVLGTRECVNLHPLNQLIRNIRLVVVALLAIPHLYVLDGTCLIIVLV